MTALAQVMSLVDAHVNRDDARFRKITLQIADSVGARAGSEGNAEQLRTLINRTATSFIALPSAPGLLSSPPELACLDEMVLSKTVRERLDRIVLEYRQREVLAVHGLKPSRKILLAGPPGTGKTMTASALARAIELPMFRVELSGIVKSYLGQTGEKLTEVFGYIRSRPAVYLFDEFDALGADRGGRDGGDAGAEMRRVVNVLLQLIEDDRSDSLILAATNHAEILDRAIFRRFDEAISFDIPTKDELVTLLQAVLVDVDVDHLDFDRIYPAAANSKLGHADVCAALEHVLKDRVLLGAAIDTDRIVAGLGRRARYIGSGVTA